MALTMEDQLADDVETHVNILRMLGALGDEEREFDVARVRYEEALTLAKEKLGGNHIFTALVLQNLGVHHEWQTNYDEAYAYYVESGEVRKRIFGDDSTHVAETLSGLGWIELQRGNLNEAATALEEAIALYAELLSREDSATANAKTMLASVYRQQERLEDSAELLQAVLEILTEGRGHFSVAISANAGAAATALALGDGDQASNYLEAAYAQAANYWSEDEPWMTRLFVESAKQAWEHGDPDGARAHWSKVVAIASDYPDLRETVLLDSSRNYLEYLSSTNRQVEVDSIIEENPDFARALSLIDSLR